MWYLRGMKTIVPHDDRLVEADTAVFPVTGLPIAIRKDEGEAKWHVYVEGRRFSLDIWAQKSLAIMNAEIAHLFPENILCRSIIGGSPVTSHSLMTYPISTIVDSVTDMKRRKNVYTVIRCRVRNDKEEAPALVAFGIFQKAIAAAWHTPFKPSVRVIALDREGDDVEIGEYKREVKLTMYNNGGRGRVRTIESRFALIEGTRFNIPESYTV